MGKKPEKEPVKKNKQTKKTKKKRKIGKIILIIIIVLILLAVIAAGAVVGIFFGMFGDELQIEKDDLIISQQNSKIVDIEGKEVIAVLGGDEKRQPVGLNDMSEYLPKAYIAIEDERFYQHHGVDIKRTGGAIIEFLLGDGSFGGSSITQQLVKNITKEDNRSGMEGVIRKVKEWARAYNIEKIISKTQILELYLNMIYVGGADFYGVEAGAQYYFSKSAKDLNLIESAFLAGINHSPVVYNPFVADENGKTAERIKNRTKTVLSQMLKVGYINEAEKEAAYKDIDDGKLKFKKGSITTTMYSYHTEALINQVISDYMDEKGCSEDLAKTAIYAGGLTIYSTQDKEIQERMEKEYEKDKWIITSRKTKDENGEYKQSQSAMVLIDHKKGYVLGTVGGLGEKTTSFGLNRATQSTRQTGSAMKPIAVIAPALEAGLITAASVYDDAPTTEFKKGTVWPTNYYSGYKGLSTVRYAIQISQNIVPVRILSELGTAESLEFLRNIGITSLDSTEDSGLSLALGGLYNGVSPLEMSAAYAMIANNGVYIEPTFYKEVKDSNGAVILEADQETRRAMSKQNAYILQSILKGVVTGGTATICAISGMDVAAKTGTTSDNYDRWLCGFTPYYTAAIWYGFDDNERIHTFGYNPGSYIFDNIMTDIHKDLKKAKFEQPDNIVRVAVCKDSGLLPTADCKDTVNGNRVYTEYFVKGTVPNKKCDTHVKAKACKRGKTYYLANEYCTDAEELVFITRPYSDKNTGWKKAGDAKFMLPTEECTRHKEPEKPEEPVEPETPVVPETPTNNTVTGNTTTPPTNTVTPPASNTTTVPENTVGTGNTTPKPNTNTSTEVNAGVDTKPNSDKPVDKTPENTTIDAGEATGGADNENDADLGNITITTTEEHIN